MFFSKVPRVKAVPYRRIIRFYEYLTLYTSGLKNPGVHTRSTGMYNNILEYPVLPVAD